MTLDQEANETENADSPQAVEVEDAKAVEVEADAESDTADDGGSQTAQSAPASRPRNLLARLWFPLTLALALIASAALTCWFYFAQYRVDQQTGEAASQTVVDAATDGTVALLTYAPDTLDKDFTAAKSHLTGDFLSYYKQFTEDIVAPAAKEKSVKTTATVVRAAVSEIHPESAVVLVFVNQATTSAQNPNGSFTASSVKVGMNKIDGKWLISSFDPI
ncbi:Mce-associated membrane protein [Mycobacterium frederiksbergense]|uniref:Mce-associated membrane protein n=1 Tax=Mycolicibacterium frederiksbergense TaxID=117567 RepID=A0ABT6KV36_9MYCO|nr:twin-arginine translocation pathway signal [Mycolicibacterium frederiksbergense]MDH6194572.1 Mce-associated membrane protein [Mycolicibacterium frederiksbergense]